MRCNISFQQAGATAGARARARKLLIALLMRTLVMFSAVLLWPGQCRCQLLQRDAVHIGPRPCWPAYMRCVTRMPQWLLHGGNCSSLMLRCGGWTGIGDGCRGPSGSAELVEEGRR